MRRRIHTRFSLPALLALAVLGLGTPPAGAAPDPLPTPEPGVTVSPAQYALAERLERSLGDDTAGSYLDPVTGELVVTVTSEAAAGKVRAQGARAEVVPRGTARLKEVIGVLEAKAKITGTAWGIDTSANQVVVEADESVPAASLDRLRAVAAPLGKAVRITRVPGVFTQEVLGGDAIHGGGYRCSAAFNVTDGTDYSFLTAGHCTNGVQSWTATPGGAEIGTTDGSSYPTNDYGVVGYTDGSQPAGTVNLYNGSSQDITGSADAIVGQALQKSGSTTRLTSGRVIAVNVTVNYSDGPVYGMVRTTACSAGGDSGGAHFSGSTALGIHSGGAGCTPSAGTAIHQPVGEALTAYGVDVY
ncbi:S1 family peptidase [Streptomyces sp. NPDC001985]|uniref:S1 family peptidase n=1 Tax=Streptomyces sp. NPDC001985 TaxID=3154406 RepID=UPI003320E88D